MAGGPGGEDPRDAGMMRLLDRLLAWCVAAIVVFLVVIVTSQLVDRHFIDIPIQAPDQYARIGLVWLTFLGFALAIRGNVAVRVDVIDHFLPPGARPKALVIIPV